MAILDIFKIKNLKKEIESLSKENSYLQKENKKVLSIEQMSIIELVNETNNKETEIAKQTQKMNDLIALEVLSTDKINELNSKINKLRNEITSLDDEIDMESYGLYRPRYDFATSTGYKERLVEVRKEQKKLIKDKTALLFNANWTVDGNKSKGRKMNNDNMKMVLRAFNNECEAAINKVKYSNLEVIYKRIEKSFTQINNLNATNKIEITNHYLELKYDELHLAFEFENKKQEEKEILREQREREREEKALLKEVFVKKKVLDKEITHLDNMIAELTIKLGLTKENDKEAILSQISELKSKRNDHQDSIEDLDYRAAHASAGYVYIISNIGSFGQNVIKIGVTRRIDPLDRIAELSSASVPFKFDVHALIFSYEAYDLERQLHQKFEKKRINKINSRKEFFKISVEELERELLEYKDLTITFDKVPEASEYRETKKIDV